MALIVPLALALPLVLALPAGDGGPPQPPVPVWDQGSSHGPWQVVFNGYGEVRGDDSQVLLAPHPATEPDRTHAALVVGRESHGDLTVQVRVTTRAQLRSPEPNPWEVGWVLWHYTSPQNFYALVLKPTGWELSKQDPAYPGGQRFLASGAVPAFPVGTAHTVELHQVGTTIRALANGRVLAVVQDDERPYTSGTLGLYTEDAQVRFDRVRIGDGPPDLRETESR